MMAKLSPLVPALILAGLLVGAEPALGSSFQKEGESTAFREMTPDIQAACARGLRWLSRNQNASGAFGNGSAPVATTILLPV